MPARAEPLLPVARHEDRQQRATRAVADVTVEPLVAAADGSSSPAAVGSSSHAEAEPSKTFPPLFERPPLCLVAFALLLSTAVALLCTVFRDALAVVLRQPSGEAAALLLLKLVSIPVVSVAFTYTHIWLALWMTFKPVNFVGCLRIPRTNVGLGWQGIIPFKAVPFALKACDNLIPSLISPQECVGRVEAAGLVREKAAEFDQLAADAVDAAVAVAAPRLWGRSPRAAKQAVLEMARVATPQIVEAVLLDLRRESVVDSTLFDIRGLVIDILTNDPKLAVDTMIEMGRPELQFIRNSGALMGGAFGLVQLAIWAAWPQRAVAIFTMPVFGAVVSALTNWLALLIIFRPLHPHRFCGVTVQGIFLRRQAAVARIYARIIASKVLTSERLTHIISRGRGGERLRELTRLRTMEATEVPSGADLGKPGTEAWSWWLVLFARTLGLAPRGTAAADAAVAELTPPPTPASSVCGDDEDGGGSGGGESGGGGYSSSGGGATAQLWDQARAAASEVVVERIPALLEESVEYVERCMDLSETLADRIAALPPDVFENMLHSCFQEDEWMLITLGGVLGFLIGLAQAFALGA